MDTELAMLVGTGATTVVGLMVTESWEQAKQRLTRLFTRGGEATTVAGELDESRTALISVVGAPDEDDVTSDITAAVRLRLRRLLERNPDMADELRFLVAEFAPLLKDGTAGSVHNAITGGTQHGPVFQGQSFSHLNLHESQRNAPGRDG
ncbi:hypothetical protein [Streptomyces sp. GbtcB6]|uniref:hypothetical protein n=1 Tax=Streptomyces sp. GbtcB6 TaxID=2824751 RepID=UPI001C2F82DA|nr:hypothetical protein [Streptomyces sp. GbtcB6]